MTWPFVPMGSNGIAAASWRGKEDWMGCI